MRNLHSLTSAEGGPEYVRFACTPPLTSKCAAQADTVVKMELPALAVQGPPEPCAAHPYPIAGTAQHITYPEGQGPLAHFLDAPQQQSQPPETHASAPNTPMLTRSAATFRQSGTHPLSRRMPLQKHGQPSVGPSTVNNQFECPQRQLGLLEPMQSRQHAQGTKHQPATEQTAVQPLPVRPRIVQQQRGAAPVL